MKRPIVLRRAGRRGTAKESAARSTPAMRFLHSHERRSPARPSSIVTSIRPMLLIGTARSSGRVRTRPADVEVRRSGRRRTCALKSRSIWPLQMRTGWLDRRYQADRMFARAAPLRRDLCRRWPVPPKVERCASARVQFAAKSPMLKEEALTSSSGSAAFEMRIRLTRLLLRQRTGPNEHGNGVSQCRSRRLSVIRLLGEQIKPDSSNDPEPNHEERPRYRIGPAFPQ